MLMCRVFCIIQYCLTSNDNGSAHILLMFLCANLHYTEGKWQWKEENCRIARLII